MKYFPDLRAVLSLRLLDRFLIRNLPMKSLQFTKKLFPQIVNNNAIEVKFNNSTKKESRLIRLSILFVIK